MQYACAKLKANTGYVTGDIDFDDLLIISMKDF